MTYWQWFQYADHIIESANMDWVVKLNPAVPLQTLSKNGQVNQQAIADVCQQATSNCPDES